MPIGFSKKSRIKFVLPADRDLPDGAYFEFRHMDCIESIEYLDLLQKSVDEKDLRKQDGIKNLAAVIAMTGWVGMKDKKGKLVEFDENNTAVAFGKIYLTPDEKWDVIYESRKQMRLTEDELKNSESQQGEQPTQSVSTVPPVDA